VVVVVLVLGQVLTQAGWFAVGLLRSGDTSLVQPGCWTTCTGTRFRCRVGPNYKKNKKKGPSKEVKRKISQERSLKKDLSFTTTPPA
jgi:hypothetical protein